MRKDTRLSLCTHVYVPEEPGNEVMLAKKFDLDHFVMKELHPSTRLRGNFLLDGVYLQKHALMERVAHQTIVMQYILELAGQLHRDPRSCVPGFFER